LLSGSGLCNPKSRYGYLPVPPPCPSPVNSSMQTQRHDAKGVLSEADRIYYMSQLAKHR
jgi:hypothetical protein